MTDNEDKIMKRVSMVVSIKHIDGQPNEYRVDFHAEAELPDDAPVDRLEEQINDFKHLAKHCTNKVMDNNTVPQSVPDTEPKPAIPASFTASDSSDEPLNFKASNTTPPADTKNDFNPILVKASNRASTPRSKPEAKNQNSDQENLATVPQVNMVQTIINKQGLSEREIFKEFGIGSLYKMTHNQVADFKRKYDPR